MQDNFYEQERRREQGGLEEGMTLNGYTLRIFGIMFAGLLLTALTAFYGYASGLVLRALIATDGAIQLIMLVAELAVVIGMTAALHKISTGVATAFFFLYAVLTGFTFSTLFFTYSIGGVILAFGATALYFGGMAVFGYLTHIDLSRLRNILLFGLIFLVITQLLMSFIPGLAVMDRVLCAAGLIIFLAYTAYDTQKIRTFYQYYASDAVMLKKSAILSALQLYLDFVNLFLYVLRLFGKRKN